MSIDSNLESYLHHFLLRVPEKCIKQCECKRESVNRVVGQVHLRDPKRR